MTLLFTTYKPRLYISIACFHLLSLADWAEEGLRRDKGPTHLPFIDPIKSKSLQKVTCAFLVHVPQNLREFQNTEPKKNVFQK